MITTEVRTQVVTRPATREKAGPPCATVAPWRVRAGMAAVLLGLALVVVLSVLTAEAAAGNTARAEALEAAEVRTVALLTYDHRTLEEDLAMSKEQTTGSFAKEYAALLDGSVATAAAQRKVSTEATLAGAGVVEGGEDSFTVLVLLTQTTSVPDEKPDVKHSRVEVEMQRVEGTTWKIAGLTPR